MNFVVVDVFNITGRGPVITRSPDASKEAWDRGDRWQLGQEIVCGDLRATVGGIERYCVPEGHPAYNDGALLLKGVELEDLKAGQVWHD